MKCIPIHIHGLSGTLVRIRRGRALQNTWIFKDTLGLFCRTSQREWSRPLSLDALSLTLTFATLLDYHTLRLSPSSDAIYSFFLFWFSTPTLCHNLHVLFRYHQAWNLPAVSRFCGFGAAEADEGMSTCLFSLSTSPRPVSGLPACGGDWDAVDDAAAGSSFTLITPREPNRGLIWVFTAGPCFSHQRCECLLKPTPQHFWSNLHHMPLKGDEPTGRRAFL